MKEPSLSLIIGPMFSGKSTELIQRLERARLAKKNCLVIKPKFDNRYAESEIVTHIGKSIPCLALSENLAEFSIPDHIRQNGRPDIVFVDEANFFTGLYDFAFTWMKEGSSLILAALKGDFRLQLIGETHTLMPLATEIKLLTSVSHVSGEDAPYSFYMGNAGESNKIIGGAEEYQARTFTEWIDGQS